MAMTPSAPHRRPPGVWQRLRRLIRQPSDILLCLHVGYFIWRVPHWLDSMALPALLQRLQQATRPPAADVATALERIRRLSRPWFRLPMLCGRNTCYMRSLLFYRFLDSGGQPMMIQIVVDPPGKNGDRLKGHAWVTVGGEIIEPPPDDLAVHRRTIYAFPPQA
jgi:hypothetical protein